MFYILLAIFISMPLCSATDALLGSNDSALVQSFYEAFRKEDSATLLSMIAEAEKHPNSQFCLWLKEEGLTDKGQGELDMGSVGYPNLYEGKLVHVIDNGELFHQELVKLKKRPLVAKEVRELLEKFDSSRFQNLLNKDFYPFLMDEERVLLFYSALRSGSYGQLNKLVTLAKEDDRRSNFCRWLKGERLTYIGTGETEVGFLSELRYPDQEYWQQSGEGYAAYIKEMMNNRSKDLILEAVRSDNTEALAWLLHKGVKLSYSYLEHKSALFEKYQGSPKAMWLLFKHSEEEKRQFLVEGLVRDATQEEMKGIRKSLDTIRYLIEEKNVDPRYFFQTGISIRVLEVLLDNIDRCNQPHSGTYSAAERVDRYSIVYERTIENLFICIDLLDVPRFLIFLDKVGAMNPDILAASFKGLCKCGDQEKVLLLLDAFSPYDQERLIRINKGFYHLKDIHILRSVVHRLPPEAVVAYATSENSYNESRSWFSDRFWIGVMSPEICDDVLAGWTPEEKKKGIEDGRVSVFMAPEWFDVLFERLSYEQKKQIIEDKQSAVLFFAMKHKYSSTVRCLINHMESEDRKTLFEKDRYRLLLEAVRYLDAETVDSIFSIFTEDELQAIAKKELINGWQLLHFASSNSDGGAVRALLRLLGDDKEALVNATDYDGNTPLMIAAKHGSSEAADLLLSHGAGMQYVSNKTGCTALTHAASYGHATVIKILQKHGANINDADREGMTPLARAIRSSRHSTYNAQEYLFDSGAHISDDVRKAIADSGKRTLPSYIQRQINNSWKFGAGGVSALLVALIAPYIAESIEFSHRYSKALREVRKKNPWGITRKEREELQKEVLKQCTFRSDGKAVRTFRLILSLGGVALLGRAIALYLPVKDAHKRPVAERS